MSFLINYIQWLVPSCASTQKSDFEEDYNVILREALALMESPEFASSQADVETTAIKTAFENALTKIEAETKAVKAELERTLRQVEGTSLVLSESIDSFSSRKNQDVFTDTEAAETDWIFC
jgi:Na+/phosphate symporter